MCASVSSDPEAGVAQTLAHLHQWHCGGQSYEWEPLSEQHGDSEAAQRGGVWLLQWSDDPGQGQAPKRQVSMLQRFYIKPWEENHHKEMYSDYYIGKTYKLLSSLS